MTAAPMAALRTHEDQQLELFRARPGDIAARDAQDLMSWPFFSLAKSCRVAPIDFRMGEVSIRVEATVEHGIATIWDADVLIWAVSQIVDARDRGLRTSRLMSATPYEILSFINRDDSARSYERLKAALDRLQSTTIVTSIRQSFGAGQWAMAEGAESTLRELGERGDIIKRMHRALTERGIDRGLTDYVLSGETHGQSVIGRLVDRGLDDELRGSAYVVVDGVDGRTHYVKLPDLDAVDDSTPGSIVELRSFEDARGERRVALATRSDLSIEAQTTASGATWLDRQLVARDPVDLGGGFGLEVKQAIEARADHLVQEGLARRDGERILFNRNLLGTLRERELDALGDRLATESGTLFQKSADSEYVAGVYRQNAARQAARPTARLQPSPRTASTGRAAIWSGRSSRAAFQAATMRAMSMHMCAGWRRRAGIAERIDADQWRIPQDFESRAAYDAGRNRQAGVRVLSAFDLEKQIGAQGATWLDRRLVTAEASDLAPAGFGQEVCEAMEKRDAHHIDQGDATRARDGRVFYRRNLLATLRERDVAGVGAEIVARKGLPFRAAADGETISGKFTGIVQLSSGKFAVVEKSHEFAPCPLATSHRPPARPRGHGRRAGRVGVVAAWRSRGLGI